MKQVSDKSLETLLAFYHRIAPTNINMRVKASAEIQEVRKGRAASKRARKGERGLITQHIRRSTAVGNAA